jgi:ActR/RegA family two-component response regulator
MPISYLGALRRVRRAEWERKIRKALESTHGNVGAAAARLGVERRTLTRWLAELPDVPRRPAHRPPSQ